MVVLTDWAKQERVAAVRGHGGDILSIAFNSCEGREAELVQARPAPA